MSPSMPTEVLEPTRDAHDASDWPAWPSFSDEEIAAVESVLQSARVNYLQSYGDESSQGARFEEEFAGYTGSRYAIALANGSLALALALRGLGIGQIAGGRPDDEVIVTPRSFMASASEIVLAGARPVFADVDRESQNLTVTSVEAALTERTRAILAVHLAGWPCEMAGIVELAQRHGLVIIEDCAQAHGAAIDGHSVGNWGTVGAFSFCTDKIMTTGGEGGMITTSDELLYKRCWSFKDHGKSVPADRRAPSGPGFQYIHDSFGTNWRLTEMQSAIGRIQLGRLADWVGRRRANAKLLNARFADHPSLRLTVPPSNVEHAYYKYYCFVKPEALRDDWSRDRILGEFNSRTGIGAGSGSCPEMYAERAFDGHPSRPVDGCPVARELGATSIMLPVHPTLEPRHVEHMADVMLEILDLASV